MSVLLRTNAFLKKIGFNKNYEFDYFKQKETEIVTRLEDGCIPGERRAVAECLLILKDVDIEEYQKQAGMKRVKPVRVPDKTQQLEEELLASLDNRAEENHQYFELSKEHDDLQEENVRLKQRIRAQHSLFEENNNLKAELKKEKGRNSYLKSENERVTKSYAKLVEEVKDQTSEATATIKRLSSALMKLKCTHTSINNERETRTQEVEKELCYKDLELSLTKSNLEKLEILYQQSVIDNKQAASHADQIKNIFNKRLRQ